MAVNTPAQVPIALNDLFFDHTGWTPESISGIYYPEIEVQTAEETPVRMLPYMKEGDIPYFEVQRTMRTPLGFLDFIARNIGIWDKGNYWGQLVFLRRLVYRSEDAIGIVEAKHRG
jgi:hypothetical protein